MRVECHFTILFYTEKHRVLAEREYRILMTQTGIDDRVVISVPIIVACQQMTAQIIREIIGTCQHSPLGRKVKGSGSVCHSTAMTMWGWERLLRRLEDVRPGI